MKTLKICTQDFLERMCDIVRRRQRQEKEFFPRPADF